MDKNDQNIFSPSAFPTRPGVYLMKNAAGRVIYVGKANNLRARISAYRRQSDSRPMIPLLMSQVGSLDFIVTKTEKEALILENSLIKAHRPRYNVLFRDDKEYFHLRLNGQAPWPRLEIIRRPREDGARYFGPYPSAGAARATLRFLQRIFPLRTCSDRELKTRTRPCLEASINRCLAPCAGKVAPDAYRHLVTDTAAFLAGKHQELLDNLRERMQAAAAALNFEEAARLRDQIASLSNTLERQAIHSLASVDQDIFGLYREDNFHQVCILSVRGGVVRDKRALPLLASPWEEEVVLAALVKQIYLEETKIPDEIILPVKLADRAMLMEALRDLKGKKVLIETAGRGRRRELIELAQQNAAEIFKARGAKYHPEAVLQELKEKLDLAALPRRIEGYDVSHLGGTYAVGARVVFEDGEPKKQGYRRFRIKTAASSDDYGMMYEILRRRLTSGQEGDEKPDLIVLDGGKGQLNVALAVLKDLGLTDIDCLALAKEKPEESVPGKVQRDEERVYLKGRKDPLYLSRWPKLLVLLSRLRNEAHRFARTYHRRAKEKGDFSSLLDNIGFLGPRRRQALLSHFADIEALRKASSRELQAVPGVGPRLARRIQVYFNSLTEPSR
jgi:excinuclease ABC subunit C